MNLSETVKRTRSEVADISFMTLYGKTAEELVNEIRPSTGLNFFEFMEIAKQAHAMDILECWDEATFNFYVGEFGPMSRQDAIDLCYFTESVSQEEMAAGEYFSRRQGLTKSLLSDIIQSRGDKNEVY